VRAAARATVAGKTQFLLGDAQLAVAVAENDQTRAEMIAPELKRALFELESIRVFEKLENIRIAQLISYISPRQN
jgi:hypothetical protein